MEQFSDTQILLLIALVAIVSFVLGRRSAGGTMANRADEQLREAQEIEQVMATLSSSKLEEIDRLMFQRKKIEAIKVLREATGLGLKAAKLAVERRAQGT